MRPNMRPTEKTDLKGALRSLTVYLQKSLGVDPSRAGAGGAQRRADHHRAGSGR